MNTSVLKRGAVAVGGAALLLSATIGFSQAQSATPSTAHKQHQAVVDLAATELGLTSDELSSALKQARKDLGLKRGALEVGKLVHQELSVAAGTLGVSDARALRKELAGGTLGAVAQKHNVQPATVAAAMKADLDARIQSLVSAGSLMPERAASLKQKAEARVDAFMTHQFKAGKAAG